MRGCNYSKITGCKECNYPFYNQCKKFMQVHARWLIRNLLKEKSETFKYQTIKDTKKHDVLWSRNPDIAKSVALQFALEKNAEVTPYTLNGALDLVTSKQTEEITSQVIYFHVTKAVGDADAIIGMIESFVDIAVRNGGKVAIYLDKLCPYKLKYIKAE